MNTALSLFGASACPRCSAGVAARREWWDELSPSYVAAVVLPFLLVLLAALRVSRAGG